MGRRWAYHAVGKEEALRCLPFTVGTVRVVAPQSNVTRMGKRSRSRIREADRYAIENNLFLLFKISSITVTRDCHIVCFTRWYVVLHCIEGNCTLRMDNEMAKRSDAFIMHR